jgi:hypothetical protein
MGALLLMFFGLVSAQEDTVLRARKMTMGGSHLYCEDVKSLESATKEPECFAGRVRQWFLVPDIQLSPLSYTFIPNSRTCNCASSVYSLCIFIVLVPNAIAFQLSRFLSCASLFWSPMTLVPARSRCSSTVTDICQNLRVWIRVAPQIQLY